MPDCSAFAGAKQAPNATRRDEFKAQRTRLQADVDELRRLLEDSRLRVASLERELNGGVRGLLARTFRR
jgi:hypothetical protein